MNITLSWIEIVNVHHVISLIDLFSIQKRCRKNRRGNQEWTIQRYKQHWAHKTQDEDKPGNYKTRGMEM
jgi:hypothetical protein